MIIEKYARRNHLLSSRSWAFSMIELLVTIAIVAIVCALAFPAILKTRDSAGQAGNISNLRSLAVASMAYASDHDGWLPDASYYGNHIPHRVWPLLPLLQEKYVDSASLSSPLALPVSKAGGGPNQAPVMVAGYTSSGDLTIEWKANIAKSPVTVAFESWANPEAWSTRGARQKLGFDAKDFYEQSQPILPSKMKILWNYQWDIPVNKDVIAIAFADGHVESRPIKAPKIFDDVMAE